MTNKQKFLNLVSDEPSDTLKNLKERKKNRKVLRESQLIAFKVLAQLDQLGWTQKKLAEQLEVSPQQVNKIVSGKENLTLETLVKLQEVLHIPLLLTYVERKVEHLMKTHVFEVSQDDVKIENITITIKPNSSNVVQLQSVQEEKEFELFSVAK